MITKFPILTLATMFVALLFVPIAAAQSVISTVPVGVGGYAIDVNPNTNKVYVLHTRMLGGANCLKTVDGSTNALIQTLCFDAPAGILETAYSLAVNPVTNRIYFGTDYRIIVVDGGSGTVLQEIDDVYAYALAINTAANHIYFRGAEGLYAQVLDGNTGQIIAQVGPEGSGPQGKGALAINPSLNRLYVRNGDVESYGNSAYMFDMLTNLPPSEGPFELFGDFHTGYEALNDGQFSHVGIAANTKTNRVYVNDHAGDLGIGVYQDEVGNEPRQDFTFMTPPGYLANLVVNSASNHVYAIGIRHGAGQPFEGRTVVWSIDATTETILDMIPIGNTLSPSALSRALAINPVNHRLYTANSVDGNLYVIGGETSVTTAGSNTSITASGATLTFENVLEGGTAAVDPILDPAQAGEVPGGFAISETLAFEITSTATFSGAITSCFNVPNVNVESDLLALRVLHRELVVSTGEYQLVDRTTTHDFPNRTVCATTTSLSPFYIVSTARKVLRLFDNSRSFRAGSTIPIKLKILSSNGQNISSAALPLTVRGVQRIGDASVSAVTDAGNSNPDSTFRFEPGAGSYIFNLQTTNLSPGRYVLSFHAGAAGDFFNTVEFQLR